MSAWKNIGEGLDLFWRGMDVVKVHCWRGKHFLRREDVLASFDEELGNRHDPAGRGGVVESKDPNRGLI